MFGASPELVSVMEFGFNRLDQSDASRTWSRAGARRRRRALLMMMMARRLLQQQVLGLGAESASLEHGELVDLGLVVAVVLHLLASTHNLQQQQSQDDTRPSRG